MNQRFSASRLASRSHRPAVSSRDRTSFELAAPRWESVADPIAPDEAMAPPASVPRMVGNETPSLQQAERRMARIDASPPRSAPEEPLTRHRVDPPGAKPAKSAPLRVASPPGLSVPNAGAAIEQVEPGPDDLASPVATMEDRLRRAAEDRAPSVTLPPAVKANVYGRSDLVGSASEPDQRLAATWSSQSAVTADVRADREPARPVVIGTIEVITPPAHREAPDSLAGLEERRAGRRRSPAGRP
jgi:hypothetical protein